ncbi:hypothetical protein BGZ83_002798, partial [Gryganskiella cystojenkinii]
HVTRLSRALDLALISPSSKASIFATYLWTFPILSLLRTSQKYLRPTMTVVPKSQKLPLVIRDSLVKSWATG